MPMTSAVRSCSAADPAPCGPTLRRLPRIRRNSTTWNRRPLHRRISGRTAADIGIHLGTANRSLVAQIDRSRADDAQLAIYSGSADQAPVAAAPSAPGQGSAHGRMSPATVAAAGCRHEGTGTSITHPPPTRPLHTHGLVRPRGPVLFCRDPSATERHSASSADHADLPRVVRFAGLRSCRVEYVETSLTVLGEGVGKLFDGSRRVRVRSGECCGLDGHDVRRGGWDCWVVHSSGWSQMLGLGDVDRGYVASSGRTSGPVRHGSSWVRRLAMKVRSATDGSSWRAVRYVSRASVSRPSRRSRSARARWYCGQRPIWG